MQAELSGGEKLGIIRWVLEAGAGASLEVETAAGTVMVPFTKAAVPVVDIENGRVIVDPPDGLMESPPPHVEEQEDKMSKDVTEED
jgi:16S rRNA processing protein RimM